MSESDFGHGCTSATKMPPQIWRMPCELKRFMWTMTGPGRPLPNLALALVVILATAAPSWGGFAKPGWPTKDAPKPLETGRLRPPPSMSMSTTPDAATTEHPSGPYFDTSDIPTILHARPGQTVHLPCRVKHLSDKVVLWIRSRDLTILTMGKSVFSSDTRFSVWHSIGGDSWTLKLAGARTSDSGRYECQINTDPKMSLAIVLQVQEDFGEFPRDQQHDQSQPDEEGGAKIAGPRGHVKKGSTVTFNCVSDISVALAEQKGVPTVEWRHQDKLVSFQASRGGISVETERKDGRIRSSLTVASVSPADAGVYTCSPSGARPASVELIIVDGERSEAMQRSRSDSVNSSRWLLVLLFTFLVLPGLRL